MAKYYPEKIKVNDTNKNDPIQVTFNSSPVMRQGEQVVLFGVKSKDKVYLGNQDYYLPLGTYQGKFNVGNGIMKRFVNPKEGEKYSSLEMSLQDLKIKLNKFQK